MSTEAVTLLIAIVGAVVTVAGLLWTVYRDVLQHRQSQKLRPPSFRRALRVIGRSRGLVLLTTFCSVSVAAYLTHRSPLFFRAEALVRIRTTEPTAGAAQQRSEPAVSLEDEMQVIGSTAVSSRVAQAVLERARQRKRAGDFPLVDSVLSDSLDARTLTLHLQASVRSQHPDGSVGLIRIAVERMHAGESAWLANRFAHAYAAWVAEDLKPVDAAGQPRTPYNYVVPVDTAQVPSRPTGRDPWEALVLAGIAGALLGVGVGIVRYSMNPRIRDREDAESLGEALLGLIPSIPPDRASKVVRWGLPPKVQNIPDLGPDWGGFARTPAGEAFRALWTGIRLHAEPGIPRRIAVTSPGPGEGKSTVAANLAVTLAGFGYSVLLIDADLRRPALHQIFRIPRDPGLTHLIIGHAAPDAVLRPVEIERLHVLPSGVIPPNPAELLASESMAALLRGFQDQFHTVILDTPPLNFVTDGLLLARESDLALLVTRVGCTGRAAAEYALGMMHGRVPLGLVLNDMDIHQGYSPYAYMYYG